MCTLKLIYLQNYAKVIINKIILRTDLFKWIRKLRSSKIQKLKLIMLQ